MFIQFVIGVIVTVVVCYQLAEIPPLWIGLWPALLVLASLFYITFFKTINLSQPRSFGNLCHLILQRYQYNVLNLSVSVIIGMNLVFWQAFLTPVIPSNMVNTLSTIDVKVMHTSIIDKHSSYYKVSWLAEINEIHPDRVMKNGSSTLVWRYIKPKVMVNWYLRRSDYQKITELPQVGEFWRLHAKVKLNHASINPGARDYEAWLFQNHIAGKAIISSYQKKQGQGVTTKPHYRAVKLRSASPYYWRTLRESVANYLNELLHNSSFGAIYRALIIGEKSEVSSAQWSVFQQTGTIHLMAISGLHMSIVALMGFVFFKWLWFIGVYRWQSILLPSWSAFGGISFATAYLLISGGGIPTQRAWIMVVCIIGFIWVRRTFQPWAALAMAALLVVIWDSRAVLSTGFWLSFSAVFFIFLSLKLLENQAKLQKMIGVQLILTVGLAPLILWHFYEVPLYSLLANIVAVPFVSILGLPVLFLAMLMGLVSIDYGRQLIEIADWLWDKLWWFLNQIIELPVINIPPLAHSVWWLVFSLTVLIGLIKMLQIYQSKQVLKFWHIVLVMVVYFSVLVFFPYSVDRPKLTNKSHQAWLTVLDVGQGQAIVIETAKHVIVYDSGPKWGAHNDAAKSVILPYLKSKGWQAIDLLMISHSDLDHSGGTKSILENLSVKQNLSGQPEKVTDQVLKGGALQKTDKIDGSVKRTVINNSFVSCHAGQAWQFDGITLEVLSPFLAYKKTRLKSDNDQSCVLKISNLKHDILIMGDLSKKGEKLLLEQYSNQPQKLQADLLVAGHHGSKYSSSLAWLKAVNPSKIVFSTGYLNRFKFPAKATLDRLKLFANAKDITWWNTACSGAVSFDLNRSGIDLRFEARKSLRKWYHHSCLKSQQGTFFQ